MATEVKGVAKLRVPYSVKTDMPASIFEQLSASQQDELIDGAINWLEATRNAEVDEIEVYDFDDEK